MLYPDPKMRTLFGWPIQWLASSIAFVWMLTGALPVEAFAASHARPSESSCDLAPAVTEGIHSSADHAPAAVPFLGTNGGAESEVESEEKERHVSTAAVFTPEPFELCDAFQRIEVVDLSAIRRASLAHRANRAPPLV